MSSPSATPNTYPYQNEPTWSKSEKAIARTAFDAALGRELHEVIQRAKQMASEIGQSSDLWDLEHYLTERRKEIDRKYDYRYSQLTQVFGRLLHEKRLREEELHGLPGRQVEADPFFRQILGGGHSRLKRPGIPVEVYVVKVTLLGSCRPSGGAF